MCSPSFHISFVIPVYNSEESLFELIEEINKVMLKINESYEIILVDDRSDDNSWEAMKKLAASKNHLKIIRLSKNFGQYQAITAGLNSAKGKWVVVMDCDLQDQPKEVLKLYNKTLEGYEIVIAKRKDRKDTFLKKLSSYIFSKVYGFLTDTSHIHEDTNFGIYHKKVIKAVLSMSDYIKSFPLFVNFVGFKKISVEVEHARRVHGKTSYTFLKLIRLAFNSIISFSNKPLKIFVKFGIIISFFAFLFGIYHLYLALNGQREVLGYSSIIISIWFLSGVIITIVGICGIYIGKIFNQTKNRPVYIIDEAIL
ncbi:MAG: glycosyltransferase family 2 protein [Flavobacteriales bacterium]|nr:glycosyltransferase family 2 protein [Flavobacteriales bacterium]